MLDLKSKLLAAGLVTAEQVKKVEDEETARKQRAKDARDAKAKRGGGGGRRDRDDERTAARAQKDHERDVAAEEALRWRKRLDQLKAAPKAEQYEAIRGWVLKHRLDDRTAVPSEQATRFYFSKSDGSIGHVTLEPDVQAKLSSAEAGLVAFMGYNGVEHAVVPAELAKDIGHVRPEWLRSLVGVTVVDDADAAPPADTASTAPTTDAAPIEAAPTEAAPTEAAPTAEAATPGNKAPGDDDGA